MLYQLLKIPVRLALKIFCQKIEVWNPGALEQGGPLLITANHPNSFLDAIIIGSRFTRPIHFLARGDAFHKSWHNRLLRMLKMIPVYRLSEGRENLELNAHAFEACRQVLAANGIVLIFIEGICVNSHQLQPFKKGAARIAIENRALENFRVLPLGIAYDSMNRFGKTIVIDAGPTIEVSRLLPFEEEVKNRNYFNEQLFSHLDQLIHVPSSNEPGVFARGLLILPALVGYVIHLPLYAAVKTIVKQKSRGTVFYDSILFGSLLFVYPLYLLALGAMLLLLKLHIVLVLALLVMHPLTALCAVRIFPRKRS